MKSLLIAIKPKWCAKIMNGEKTIEVRKNKALASAIRKLINENGYADIYVYCSKEKPYLFKSDWSDNKGIYCVVPTELNKAIEYVKSKPYYGKEYTPVVLYGTPYGNLLEKRKYYNGKVIFKFRCYKVVEIIDYGSRYLINDDYPHTNEVARQSCLDFVDLKNYLKGENGYAIHISHLEIFDKPKELIEFDLKNAPQNFYYLEEN